MRALDPLLVATVIASARLPAQTISGRVYDSVAKAPLAGAAVQLVSSTPGSAPMSVTTDTTGRYVLNNVPPGRYVLGFYHDALDSLGIEPPFVRIEVGAGGVLHADLGVPGPTQILTAICGARPAKDSLGALIGHLYDATTRSGVSGGHIIAEWRTYSVVTRKLQISDPQVIATTLSNGWFAICGVPRGDVVVVEAVRGGDTTGAATVRVPQHGLARRDLFVGANEIVTVPVLDSLGAPDTARAPQRVQRGRSRVTGAVVDANSGRPLVGAQVSISGAGLTVTTNERGAFTISGVPGGTQTLLVRAVAFAPEQRTVDLLGETPLAVDVRLLSLRSVLDTMRVTAGRIYSSDANGFEQRRTTGSGTYFDAADVERTRPVEATQLLRAVNGVQVVGGGMNQKILMSGAMNLCEPSIVIDGIQLPELSAADMNMMVMPEEIVGMEIYTSAGRVPAQFKGMSQGRMGCGAVVVWTRRVR